jgi:hypothetical protein
MSQRLSAEAIANIVNLVPDVWLMEDSSVAERKQHRDAYIEYLVRRLEQPRAFVEEAISARSRNL